MSLYEKVYLCTDRGREGPAGPPDERPALLCPECGALLLSSQAVRRETLFGDVVGCELCTAWSAVEGMGHPPAACPNCGEEPGEGAELLLGAQGVPLACSGCAGDALAAYHCGSLDEGLAAGRWACTGQGTCREHGCGREEGGGTDRRAGEKPLVAVAGPDGTGRGGGNTKDRAG